MEFIWEFTKADIPDSPLILPKHLKKRGISWSAALKIPIQPYSPEENSGGLNKIMTAGIPRQRESGRMYGQKKLTAVI